MAGNLNGVAAVSANDVWAVGGYLGAEAVGGLILHWDGTAWTINDSNLPGSLTAITAVSADDIWAVGSVGGGQYGGLISVHWDGTAWTQFSVPVPGNGAASALNSVAAVAPNDVWAVGTYQQYPGSGAFMEHWDGTSWSLVSSASYPGVSSQLSGVSARSASDIWAVGSYLPQGQGAYARTLAMHWNGSAWSVVPGANAEQEAFDNRLYAIDARQSADIWAVGSTGTIQTLAEKWSGSEWVVAHSASPGLASNILYGIAALSSNDIWAVGSRDMGTSYGGGVLMSLIEHWNGAQWSIVPIANPYPGGGTSTALRGVAAVAPDDVWAAGVYGPGPDYGVYVVHWDGTRWSQVTVPNPNPDYYNNVYDITAISANDVYLVGFYGFDPHPLIMHYDGSSWTVVQNTGVEGLGVLNSIRGTGPNDVWAVGSAGYSPEPASPLVLHFDGSTWTRVPVPALVGYLASVTAISPTDAWAVGSYYTASPTKTLTLHWDGAAWTQVDSPNSPIPGIGTQLNTVAATGPNDVWAVGAYGNSPNAFTYVLHWDGATWNVIDSQNPGAIRNYARGMAAIAPGDVWFVGSHFGYTPDQTMVQHIGRFSDVHPADYFNTAVNWLVSRGAISGYSDCTFRPMANTTRGQLCKIVVLAEGWPANTRGGPHFDDVDTADPFYRYIETAYNRGVISGYANHTFRPNKDITRAQLSKVIVLSEGWTLDTTGGPHFSDVPPSDAFYAFVETAYNKGIISGYAGGTFRPGNSATRGQIAKIVYLAVSAP
jgi:hypothetical protein